MSKEKPNDDAVTIDGNQLVSRRKNRNVITGPLSSDIGFGGGIPYGCTVLFGGKAKSGKAQPLDAYVLTPTGFVKMGDIKVGDFVIGANGKKTQVTGIFPQGEQEILEITMLDGRSTECTKDHLWTVKNIRTDKISTVTTAKIITDTTVESDYIKYLYKIPILDISNNTVVYSEIRKIVCSGRKECQCISVKAKDGLYVTNSFIVTHNTTTVLQYSANGQKKYGSKIFYFNIEGRLDNKVLKQVHNLDLNNFYVVMGPEIIKDKQVIGHRKMSSQQWWDKIGQTIVDNPGCIMIVDSISALSEQSELDESMGYMSRGGLQKLEAQFQRKYGDLIVQNGIILFLLAQVQANTSGYGESIQIKCGNAIRHLADGIVFIRSIEKWKEDSKDKRILGQDMHWRVESSPLGCPFIETVVPLRFGYGLDYCMDLVKNAIDWGIIKASGAWYSMPFSEGDKEFKINCEDTDDKVKVQGIESCRQFLNQNEKAAHNLDQYIREKILI